MEKSRPYSTLFEQGESVDYHYMNGDGYSEAAGKKKKKKTGIVANFRKNQAMRQNRKNIETKNQSAAIKAMSKSGPALKLPPLPKTKKETGLSMGAKIGIGAGVLLVLGAIGFMIYKKSKK